jgi:flagellin
MSVGTGLGALAEAINRVSDQTGVRASARVELTGSNTVAAGSVKGLIINGITIGTISTAAGDSNGNLRNAINAVTTQTGVTATVDAVGRLSLTSVDGRGIIARTLSASTTMGMRRTTGIEGGAMSSSTGKVFMGRITLTSLSARDIMVSSSVTGLTHQGIINKMSYSAAGTGAPATQAVRYSGSQGATFTTTNLRSVGGYFTNQDALGAGAYANGSQSAAATGGRTGSYGVGVTTKVGAMMVMDIAQSAMQQLDKIRAGLGSAQQQLTTTINNITVTQVNVTAAESQIRDVDFAAESANFSKRNLLAQSGAYAMSQANQVQQNVMRLLQ